jgi:hypothetical protein
MSPDDIISLAQTLVDDEPDADEFAMLLDSAYTIRNDERIWSFLLKLDSSITHGSSDTWQTTHTLPTDFAEAYRVFGGASDNEYDPVPYEEILRWINSSNKYSIDHQGNTMRFTGAPGSPLTVYFWYKYFPTSLIGLTTAQSADATTIVWPRRFCPILAFDMASMHLGGIDADDITRQQVPYLNSAHTRLHQSMLGWDNRRRMKMFDNSASSRRTVPSDRPDVVSWPN